MKVYISGPISLGGKLAYDDCRENIARFARAADALRVAGHEPVNPCANEEENLPWSDYMRADLLELLVCEGVALLPGWFRSRGSRLEVQVAEAVGLQIDALDGWL